MHQHQLSCCYHTFARLYLGSGRWDAVGILCEFDFINTRRIFLLDLHHLQVEAELEAFGGVDNVVVERTTNTSVDDFVMYQYTIYFVGKAVAGDVPQIQVVDVGHNGCRATYNATAGQEAETLVDSFIPLYKVQNTPDLTYDATAADVKAAIEGLSGACTVDVSRSVRKNGYEWLVTFTSGNDDRLLRAMRSNALLLDNIADYVNPTAMIVPILREKISTPKSGVPYYVRAAAINTVGAGSARISSPTSLQPAAQTPSAPTSTTVQPLSDTELMVQWEAPFSDGGDKITEYVLEWDTQDTFDSGSDGSPQGSAVVDASGQESIADVQAVRVSVDDGMYLSGSFFLEYNGQTTGSIAFDASAAVVKSALEALCTVGNVAVTRTLGPANGGYTWLITVTAQAENGEAGDGQVSTTSPLQTVGSHKLRVDGQNLLVCGDAARSGCWSDPDRTSVGLETKQETQRIMCQPITEFNITFMGETTEPLSTLANSTEIEAALEALYNIGDVTVTGACDSTAATPYIYITFENDAGDLPALTSSLDGNFEEVSRGGAQVVVGRKAFVYTISDIAAATPWTVRISAYNRVGYGDYTTAMHDSSEMVSAHIGAPSLPENVVVEVATARSAWVYWDGPASDGGNVVTEYIVDIDTSNGFDSVCGDGPEVQTLTMSADTAAHSGETFNLTIGEVQYLTCLDWNTTVVLLQDGLRSFGGALGNIVVTRGGDGTAAWAYGYTYSITFVHNTTDSGLPDFPEIEVESCGTGSDIVEYDVVTLKDGTDAEATACQAGNLLPLISESTHASEAEGAGETTLREYGYEVTGLIPGMSYRARVAAVNAVARSPWSFMGYPGTPSIFSPSAEPKVTRNVTVAQGKKSSDVYVAFGLPVGIDVHGVEGLPLEGFRVEMSKRVHEAQVVSVVFAPDANGAGVAYPTQGSYTLSVGNATTWCLEWNASALEVELALDTLATVDGVSVEALLPEINSTSNGTTSDYASELLLVSFTGPHLSNGDQDLMEFSICTTLDAGAYVDIYTVTDGVAGAVSPVVTVSTTSSDNTTISGYFVMSFGYRGELGLRLGEGNKTSVYATVEAGSRTIFCSSDLSHYVNQGDPVSVGGVELEVAGDFTCEDTVTSDNSIGEYPCSFKVEYPHPYGAKDVSTYGAANMLGSVHVETGTTQVLSDWDLTPHLVAGDSIVIRDPTSGKYFHSLVAAVSDTSVTLEDGYEGPSAVRASAYGSPYAVVPFDASAEEVRDAIESLPSVGSAEVSREGPDENSGFKWSVTLTSFNGPLSGAYSLKVASTMGKVLNVTDCDNAGNGVYAATGETIDGRSRYKLVDRPSYIEYDSSADEGEGLWILTADGMEEPYAKAILGADAPARDSLVPPTGSASYWSTGCVVATPSSPVSLLNGVISSEEYEGGVEGGFSSLAKDVVTESGISEVQMIQLGATSDALDGTFLVDFDESGGFTAAWDISAEDLEVHIGIETRLG